VLRKDHLRVSRAGGGYHPQFVEEDAEPLAARVRDLFRDHVGERRGDLDDALAAVEADVDDFKLVRGLAALLERDATFETEAQVPPARARRVAFEAAEAVEVASSTDREQAMERAADGLGVTPRAVDESLYADRDENQVLTEFDPRWESPELLVERYNLSLAQTALFDATELRVRSADPKRLVSSVKRLGLMYEIRTTDLGREVVVTGPDGLFRRTRRYGTAFARLLRTVAEAPDWRIEATIDDRGTERTMTLADGDVTVPGVEPLAEPSFDSGVEADFAGRFRALDLDWTLVREPEPLETGSSVMIPDFAFDYDHADFRVFFEVMGFWTPEYVEKKLGQLANVEDVELVVAVDESLGVGEEIAARDHRVVTYSGGVPIKDVVEVLREYEADLVADASAELPGTISPDADVITLETVASNYGVAVEVIADRSFPDNERVGRTLIRPAVLEEVDEEIDAGDSLADVGALLNEYGIEDSSAILSALGYRVEWEGLGGGTVRAKDPS